TAQLINALAGVQIIKDGREEEINMCKAIDDMINAAVKGKEEIIQEKEEVIQEKEEVIQEKDKVIQEKDKAIQEKDKAIQEKDKAIEESFLAQCGIIRSIMEKLFLSAEEAMDVAGIQPNKRGRILAMLQ
ncbi:MAG: hypothetical protein K6E30_05400, partial [Lachnospiraceae bacterium]|nr:hypothetical protein [Lachnospiraceae bacterium]